MEDKLGLPVAGGLLDQTESFLSAAQFIHNERAWMQAQILEQLRAEKGND